MSKQEAQGLRVQTIDVRPLKKDSNHVNQTTRKISLPISLGEHVTRKDTSNRRNEADQPPPQALQGLRKDLSLNILLVSAATFFFLCAMATDAHTAIVLGIIGALLLLTLLLALDLQGHASALLFKRVMELLHEYPRSTRLFIAICLFGFAKYLISLTGDYKPVAHAFTFAAGWIWVKISRGSVEFSDQASGAKRINHNRIAISTKLENRAGKQQKSRPST
jgi:hypothetical protein